MSVYDMLGSIQRMHRQSAQVIDAYEAKKAHHEYVSDLHRRYAQGERFNFDHDPWLSPKDIAYIVGASCTTCGNQYCICDDLYQQGVDNEMSHMQGDGDVEGS